MQILHRGKTEGFALLKTLIFSIPLLLIMGAMLFTYAQLLRYSGSILEKAQVVVEKENLWVETQLKN